MAIRKHPLTRISSYSSASKKNRGAVFSQLPGVFEQSLITQRKNDTDNDLLYEVTDSKLDFSHIVKTEKLNKQLNLLVQERENFFLVKHHNLPLSNKILLHGKPGCGKTLTAYCLAGELKKPLYIVSLGNIISSKLGETAQNLEKIFKKAKDESAILFLDEFDILSRERNSSNEHGEIKRVVNVILQILDLLDENTIFIAATNQHEFLDKAITRRFNYVIEYPAPDTNKIKEYIKFLSKSYKFSFKKEELLGEISNIFEGNSYADIKNAITVLLKEKIFKKKNPNTKGIIINQTDIKNLKKAY